MPRLSRTAIPWMLSAIFLAPAARADRNLQEYRYFRALSVDLQGRMPTRDELTLFERADFNVETWIDQRLQTGAYAERMRELYMDLLRLETSDQINFVAPANFLKRQRLLGPTGQPFYLYYREGQRRDREATDGTLCLSSSETGVQIGRLGDQIGTAHNVTQATLDRYTVELRPWWLYRDYRSTAPTERFNPAEWARRFPLFTPLPALLTDADGRTPTSGIRVCREESAVSTLGHVYTSGRTTAPVGPPFAGDRATPAPVDSAYARAHRGEEILCNTTLAFTLGNDCGCGQGLERCMPGANSGNDPQSMVLPSRTPLGLASPIDNDPASQEGWHRFWWAQEASHFLEVVFREDRDFRDLLTARDTYVNGPIAQFYRFFQGGSFTNRALDQGYSVPQLLVNPEGIPADLLPHDTNRWVRVSDRGAASAGILSMPIFLVKYGQRRSRAHVLYNAFLCREFVAENITLTPSTESNLMNRPGCALCHATLEPLASYFSRVLENGWTYLPPSLFPVQSTRCTSTLAPGSCRTFYDPAFSTPTGGMLRGAYGSPANADAGIPGAGQYLTRSPDFAPCVAQNVASAFLGRQLTPDDQNLKNLLAERFTTSNFHLRALVRALVLSDAYRRANNLNSTVWRQGEGAP